jgi:hypothetical protein
MRQMHPRSAGLQNVDRPVPAVRCFQHHLGLGASLLELQCQRDGIVDDPHRRQLLTRFGQAHDHRPLPMQIDPDELPAVILIHRGLPLFVEVSTPSIRRERHEERRPRPFIASSGLVAGSVLAVCPGDVFVVGSVVAEAAVEDPDESVTQCA